MEEHDDNKKPITIPAFSNNPSSSSSHSPNPNPNPNASFSQAFSFIKSSDFYSPPPPPPHPEPSAAASTAAGSAANRNAILVSHRQKGNPLLKHIRNVKWVFTDVVCDYLLGQTSCALYLSLRYHLLHPDYLYFRIRELQKSFKLRVVLCHVDVEDVAKPLLEVTRTSLLHDCTLLCAWSLEECGRYLETIKVYENKSADNIREQMDNDYLSRFTHALTAVRRVNKTDVVTLGSNFGSLSRIMDASMEELARCPGIGERKVKRLHDAFHEPFRRACPPMTLPYSLNESKDKNANEPCKSDDNKQVHELKKVKHSKETSLTVKSALTAAFAKYKNKARNQVDNLAKQGQDSNAASASTTEN